VRYRIAGPLGNCGICHCRMCQKASGNFGMILVSVPGSQIFWSRGTPAVFRSTPVTVRGFCQSCGTPLFMREDGDNTLELTVGSLDNPDLATPTHEVGIESKRAWFHGITGLPGKTTDADRAPEDLARLQNLQHPDHDTQEWPLSDRGS
jgi:hypothetical protein